jgi:F-box domain
MNIATEHVAESIKAIPMDVVCEILQYVDSNQLPIFALVCRGYQVEAERLLYWRIVLDRVDLNTYSCFDTLSTVPHKARLVRSMVVHWRAKSVMAGTARDSLKFVGNALLATTSLKHLYMRFRGMRPAAIRGIVYPLLKWNSLLHANSPSTDLRKI